MLTLNRDGWLLFATRFTRLFAYGALSVVLVFYLVGLGLTEAQTGLLLTATLIGQLIHEGVYDLWARAPVDEWQRPDDPRRAIRIADLLRMSSGLRFIAPQDPDFDPARGYPDHLYVYTGAIDAHLGRPVLGRLQDIENVLHSGVIDEVAICLPPTDVTLIEPVTRLCEEEGKIVRIPLEPVGLTLPGGRTEEFDGIQVLSLVYGPDRTLALIAKQAADIVLAGIGLIVLSPLLAAVAIAIALSDGRSAWPGWRRATRSRATRSR